MSVFTVACVDLAKYKPNAVTNIIMWLFSHFLACKEVYHIMIFIYAQLVCLYFARSSKQQYICLYTGNKLGKCIIVSYPGCPHTLSLQNETGFVCKCDSMEMRILLDM